MAIPSNPTGQPKYALENSSDGLTNALLTHAASGHQVFPRRRASDGLVNASPAPANASTESSSQMKHLPYDVFINHYGKDAKHGIATNIYNKLDATGLRVFLDKDELRSGDFFPEALEAAMRTSSVHIAIFSENYARSRWCMDELEFILRLPGIKFIPIFYHVEPSTLRWVIKGKGIYGLAFNDHAIKSRFNSKKLENWKSALRKASNYTGEIINNQGEEEKAVNNVVNLVLKELKKVRINVAKHPVGLDEAEQDFNNTLLNSAAREVQMVGVWGMGGAGKTTIAKHIFNKRSLTFGRSCFVSDVREAARKEALYDKQKELLKGLDLGTIDINNVDTGREILRGRLKSVPVLLVLDDIDHIDQLDALVPDRDSLGKGSLIIVTTRENRVLKAWGISAIYKIRALNTAHAKELFCWHAFAQPSPLLGFEDLAEKFNNACHGLPLSLKVFGGLLCGESDKNYWESQLDKVSRIVPDDIKLRLRISYDALDEEEKEMFLDVACFFIGEKSSWAIAVWDGSGWNGLHGWQRLANKCLVELDEYNHIKMHDHLRDLGREFANTRSPYRLWSKTQIIKIKPQQVAVQVRGMADAIGDNCRPLQGHIILNTNQGKRTLQLGSLGLKIFIGDGDLVDEQYCELSKDLLCFQWTGFRHTNFPSWLPLKKLRILHLWRPERLQGLWERDADGPSALKELFVFHACKLEKIENLKSLTSLEELWIYDCPELDGLPGLGESTSLRKISLEGCKKLQKMENLKSLTSLEELCIDDCPELDGLPGLGESSSLREITLRGFKKLQKMENLKSLTSLEELLIDDCPELDGLPSLGESTSLKKITLRRFKKLQKMENLKSLTSLEELCIDDCPELDGLPSLGESTSLRKITLRECKKLQKMENLKSLTSLEELCIDDCPELDGLPGLGESSSLREITLRGFKKLQKIEGLESLTSLGTLKINDCRELIALPSLEELTLLKTIELRECHNCNKIEGIGPLRLLETMIIHDCTEFKTLPNLAGLTSLKKLELIRSYKLEKIIGLESLRSLEKLTIEDCPELDTLPSLVMLTLLEEFNLDKLEVNARLKPLCGVNLEQRGGLMSLMVTANDLSVVESLISKIQTMPNEVIVCTRAAIDVSSLKNFFTCYPLKNVVEFTSYGGLKLRRPQYADDANAILICFIIDSLCPEIRFHINADTGSSFGAVLGSGKWVWMGVFPRSSDWLQSKWYEIWASSEDKDVKLKEVWLVMGKQGNIRQAFHHLSQSNEC